METPLMIFLFLCLAVLAIMFYLVLRSMDELLTLMKEERSAMSEQFRTLTRTMEHMAVIQRESRDILHAMLGPVNPVPPQPPVAQQSPENKYVDQDNASRQNNVDRSNITNYILAE